MGPPGWRWIEQRFPNAETTLHFLPRDNDEPSKGPVLVLVDDRVEEIVSRLQSKEVDSDKSATCAVASGSYDCGVSGQRRKSHGQQPLK